MNDFLTGSVVASASAFCANTAASCWSCKSLAAFSALACFSNSCCLANACCWSSSAVGSGFLPSAARLISVWSFTSGAGSWTTGLVGSLAISSSLKWDASNAPSIVSVGAGVR